MSEHIIHIEVFCVMTLFYSPVGGWVKPPNHVYEFHLNRLRLSNREVQCCVAGL